MTETEAKWVERVREWERSGLPMDQFVVGKPYQASTLLWRKRQLQHQKRLEMAAPQRGRVAAARGRRRTATTESTRQLSPPSCPPIAMATVVRKPSMSRAPGTLTIEIGSARVSVVSGFDPALLKDVIRALQGAA